MRNALDGYEVKIWQRTQRLRSTVRAFENNPRASAVREEAGKARAADFTSGRAPRARRRAARGGKSFAYARRLKVYAARVATPLCEGEYGEASTAPRRRRSAMVAPAVSYGACRHAVAVSFVQCCAGEAVARAPV